MSNNDLRDALRATDANETIDKVISFSEAAIFNLVISVAPTFRPNGIQGTELLAAYDQLRREIKKFRAVLTMDALPKTLPNDSTRFKDSVEAGQATSGVGQVLVPNVAARFVDQPQAAFQAAIVGVTTQQ